MKITHAYLVLAGLLGLDHCLAAPLVNTTVNHPCPCRKRPPQVLIDHFNTVNSNANCFNIETLSTSALMLSPEQNTTTSGPTAEALFSILSGDTRCLLGLQQSTQCFIPANQEDTMSQQCIWAQKIQRTGHGRFPEFEVHAACSGCSEGDSSCLDAYDQCFYRENMLSYFPLVRGQRCDQEGYEMWTAANLSRSFNAACSCIRAAL